VNIRKAHVVYEVPYADTDRMGVIYYANYLVYFERARTQLLRDFGHPYAELERDGVGLPVIEAHVDYKSPATYGDMLDIYGWTGWVRRARLRVDCEVRCGDVLLASGYTVHACIDLATQRPMRVPKVLNCLHPVPGEGEPLA